MTLNFYTTYGYENNGIWYKMPRFLPLITYDLFLTALFVSIPCGTDVAINQGYCPYNITWAYLRVKDTLTPECKSRYC